MLVASVKLLVEHTSGKEFSTLTYFQARVPETIKHFSILAQPRGGGKSLSWPRCFTDCTETVPCPQNHIFLRATQQSCKLFPTMWVSREEPMQEQEVHCATCCRAKAWNGPGACSALSPPQM